MSKWPVHSNPRESCAAKAPYNFVPLPDQVVTIDPNKLPDHDRYQPKRHTGWLDCTLTTESPLYVRAARKPAEEELRKKKDGLAWDEQARNKPDFFYTEAKSEDKIPNPVIPGSSLRGMLRSLVEIIASGKMQWVTDQQHYFFRAVAAARISPLARPYKDALRIVTAGYVMKRGEAWYVLPAKRIEGETYLKVKAEFIKKALPNNHQFDNRNYLPGYIPVSFTYKQTPKGRWIIDQVGQPGEYSEEGMIVCSGNMRETTQTDKKQESFRPSPRRNHSVVPEPKVPFEHATLQDLIKIDEQAIREYQAGLTDFQKQNPPFDPKMGVLSHKAPIFYLSESDESDEVIRRFGHTPNFRIPYRMPGAKNASSPHHFVPDELRREHETDFAEAIFGYSKSEGEGKERAYAGRVFVTDAKLAQGQEAKWLNDGEPVMPKILGTPKPTTFQHYLTQKEPNYTISLRHYGSQSPDETVIRGHKLYWHQGQVGVAEIQEEKPEEKKDSQHTQFRPVAAGVRFEFRIYFENLSLKELGALLWVLDKAGNDAYRFKLGMGKPLGMGAVKIKYALHRTEREERYRHLFQDKTWALGVKQEENLVEQSIKKFESFILKELNPVGAKTLEDLVRMQTLLAMLSWPGPSKDKTRYLKINHEEHGNEYKNRPVLPDPLVVSDWKTERIPPGFQIGTVKVFGLGVRRNYGFIVPDKRDGDLFVHLSKLAEGVSTLYKDQIVVFRRVRAMKGYQAEDVQPWPLQK
jgi:CRISPR-associated protein (TIGR03986 family)